ncbi:MAG: DUF4422 domain-containing protein [Anaerovibrio sp.]
MDIKLFISHRIDRNSPIIVNNIFTPIYCGATYKVDRWSKGIIGDNTGDNISSKRESFCEFTVQYWAWKNVNIDYYGLCHYRRYFSLNAINAKKNEQNQIYLPFITSGIIKKFNISNEDILRKMCEEYDAIFPEPAYVENITSMGANPASVLDLWRAHEGVFFDKNTIDILLECIKSVQPAFYKDAIDYLNSTQHRGYNCYIMHKNLFFTMCEFEFSVLFDLEEKLDAELIKKYPRTMGYMGEILFGVFQYRISKTNKKIAYRSLVFFENSDKCLYSIMRYFAKNLVETFFSNNQKRFIKSYMKRRTKR